MGEGDETDGVLVLDTDSEDVLVGGRGEREALSSSASLFSSEGVVDEKKSRPHMTRKSIGPRRCTEISARRQRRSIETGGDAKREAPDPVHHRVSRHRAGCFLPHETAQLGTSVFGTSSIPWRPTHLLEIERRLRDKKSHSRVIQLRRGGEGRKTLKVRASSSCANCP